MEWISRPHQDQIAEQLNSLGFMNFQEILQKEKQVNDPRDPSLKAILHDDLYLEGHFIGEMLIQIREKLDKSWEIDQLVTWVQFLTKRDECGVVELSNEYNGKIAPIPPYKQILDELMDRVKTEEEREKFYLTYDLRTEFKQLGFEDLLENHWYPKYEHGYKVWTGEVEINHPITFKKDLANFLFVIAPSRNKLPEYLATVRVSLVDPVKKQPLFSFQAERGADNLNIRLPTKEEMLQEVLAIARVNQDPYEEIRKRFRIGVPFDKTRQNNNYSQRSMRFKIS